MLGIKYFAGKGRGVVADKAYARGELIERAPVIVIPPEECDSIENTVVGGYYYGWGEKEDHGALVLGYGSLYNHSYQPNATYSKDFANLTFDFIAVKDIQAGEEITINYNQDPDDQSPVWFDVVEG